MIEEWLFLSQYRFHRQKIILHRATMQFYREWLIQKGFTVTCIDAIHPNHDIRTLIPFLAAKGITEIHYAATADDWLKKRLESAALKNKIALKEYPSPNFLNTPEEAKDFFDRKKTYFQTDFYIWQRKKRNILLDGKGQPLGGKWTFDTDNRLKFPKSEVVPDLSFPGENKYVKEAKEYTAMYFKSSYGEPNLSFFSTKSSCFYPTTFDEAEQWLKDFLRHRFTKFGIYEDAMVKDESILYHSVFTPMLNIGLLNPQQVIDNIIEHGIKNKIPLNSLEGFARQVIGWREFIWIVYEREGLKQRTTNYWKFKRKIPETFWNGTTGIHPVDTVIKRILGTGYCHHIERLMVLGNFMLLCEFDPDEVYRWFMEMFIDAYDWVMVPNVYGMSQFADGGLMTTKPYISGSNYLMKMGNWEKGEWQEIWDGLFWRFMHMHRGFFIKNPRLGMLINTFDKMPAEKRNKHLETAEQFLHQFS